MSTVITFSDSETLLNFNLDDFATGLGEKAVTIGLRIVFALIVLIIGSILLWVVKKIFRAFLKKKETNIQVARFVVAIIVAFLRVILWMIILDILGINIGGFAAILAAIVFALAFALQSLLQQLVAGLVLLNGKRINPGEVVDHKASGNVGIIQETLLFDTLMLTFDNRLVKIPNMDMLTTCIILPGFEATRRVDFNLGIAYASDIPKARKILAHCFDKAHKFLKDPPYQIICNDLTESKVGISARAWCKTKHYWDLYFGVMESIKAAFGKHGIAVPYPSRNVHLYNEPDQAALPAPISADDLELSEVSDFEDSVEEEVTSLSKRGKLAQRLKKQEKKDRKDDKKKAKHDRKHKEEEEDLELKESGKKKK